MNTNLIDSIGWTLLHFIWQGGVIACATALALALLGNVRPQHRYLVACTGLLACLVWPAVALVGRLRDGAANAADAHFAHSVMTGAHGGPASGLVAFLQDQLTLIVSFWAVCACVLALRMVAGMLWLRRASRGERGDARLQRQTTELAQRFGVKRPVRLRVVDDLDSPVTALWWRPVVLVPAALVASMPPALLDALLAHEMAHIKRADYLVNLGQNVIETLLFYHPAVWWISGCMRAERELVADAIAAAHLAQPRQLAQALSELEKFAFSGHRLAQAANGGELAVRIGRLLKPNTRALNWKAAIPVLGLAVACLSVVAHAAATGETHAAASEAQAPLKDRAPRANFKTCSRPVWPASSLAAGHTGKVTLAFQIAATGQVVDGKVAKSSGDPLLDQAALNAISQCSVTPAIHNGKPVAAKMAVQYVWTFK